VKKLIQETPKNIKDLRFYCLQDLELNVLKGYQQNLVFAIDEAGLAQEFLYGVFRSPKSNHKRGMLTALVESLMEMKVSTIYAATNRSLGMGETLQSDIGKKDISVVISNFEVTNEMSNRANLGRLVNLEGCDLNTIKGFELLLSGRSRFYASLLTELAELEPNGGNLTKQEVLTMAIQRSIANHRKKLVERFSMALRKTTWKEEELLKKLYVAVYFFGGNVTFVLENEESEIDLVHIGLASLRQVNYEGVIETSASILEPLSVEVIKDVLSQWDPMAEIRQRLHRVIQYYGENNVGKANAFEMLTFCSIKMLCSKVGTVAEFAERLLSPDQIKVLPAWTKEASLSIIKKISSVERLGVSNEAEYLKRALEEDANINETLLTNLPIKMRPDCFGVFQLQKGKEAPKFFWTFLASCKLYNNHGFPSKDILNDQNSTDFNLLYHTADGGEINDKKSHNAWKKVLEESRGYHVGSLRLHIILPHICS